MNKNDATTHCHTNAHGFIIFLKQFGSNRVSCSFKTTNIVEYYGTVLIKKIILHHKDPFSIFAQKLCSTLCMYVT